MYEDMLDNITGNRHCESCKTVTRHALIELVMVSMDGEIHELIDSWFQCQDCDQTTAISDGPDDFPF